jgi:hypothetical protein
MKLFGGLPIMSGLNWFFRSNDKSPSQPDGNGLNNPTLESTSYEFMLESLMEVPSERFDRWRSRSHERG